MEQTIRGLVLAAQGGDQQAIAQLYEQSSKKAYYLAKQLLKNEDLAQDILQDSYVKVFSNLHMLRQPENFQGWLDTVVINKSKDYLKKKKPVLFSQMSSEEEPDKEIDFEDDRSAFQPEAQVDYKETKRLVQAMIDSLPEEQRMAVVLRYLEDMPVKRIAQIMECSEGTVKSRLNYGRKAIKAQVLELEKKGTKLYCMPLIPFLYWMFRQQVLSTVAPAFAGVGAAAAAGAASGSAQAAGASSGAAGASSGAASGAGQAAVSGQATAAGGAAQGAASGAGAAAGGLGKGVAAAAVKTGAAAAGKGIAVKAAAVAAAVCIGGGAAAGGVYLARRSEPAAVEEAEYTESDESLGESANAEGAVESGLTEEEQEALAALYQAVQEQNYERTAGILRDSFDVLYLLSAEKFQGEYYLFDGEKLSNEINGNGLLLRTGSTVDNFEDGRETSYDLTGYYGDFSNGEPDGELLAIHTSKTIGAEIDWGTTTFTKSSYENGSRYGNVEAQMWSGVNGWQWEATSEGTYDQETESSHFPYIGNFRVTVNAQTERIFEPTVGREPERMPAEMLPDQVIFEIEVQEGKTWEGGVTSAELEEAEPTRIMMTDDGIGGLLLLDETGQYCVENSSMRRWIRMPRFWNDSSPSYEADTALLEESASETDTPKAETTSSPISYEGAEEVLQIAEQNSQNIFQANTGLYDVQETEEGYLLPVQLLVPVVFDQDPMEGKTDGDVISVVVSDVTGQTAEFMVHGEEFDLFWSSNEHYEDGKWRAITNNDFELAKEVYLGEMLLRKDAVVRVLKDYYAMEPELISIEEFLNVDENSPWYWCTQETVGIDEPEQTEEIIFNQETGQVESSGRMIWNYDYETLPGNFEIVLDDQGNILELNQNWIM